MEGWKIGSNRPHPSIFPAFQSVKSFSKNFETCYFVLAKNKPGLDVPPKCHMKGVSQNASLCCGDAPSGAN